MSNGEQGIFQAQARAASEQLGGKDGLRDLQHRSSHYLDERVVVYLLALVMVGLFMLWMTTRSVLVIYGSLGLGIALILVWGRFQLRSSEKLRRTRELQARSFEASKTLRNPGK
ncbi:MAG TPA: hypothetical protein VKB27_06390 [Gammaproteobacteria bacterium]|nr:hypothetical protein [Gammaproteobacteria bacterium]